MITESHKNNTIKHQQFHKRQDYEQGVSRRLVLLVIFFLFVKLKFIYFVVAICDLVHSVEAMTLKGW